MIVRAAIDVSCFLTQNNLPMERSKRDRLEDLCRTTSALVEIPSFYSPEHKGDEVAIQECVEEMLRSAPEDLRIEKQIVGGESSRRENIIAMRGAPIEEAKFVVLLVCHTDTVRKEPGWVNDYKLVQDGEMWRGVGVYDMKSGAAINVDFMQHGNIPEGVCVVAAFIVGEEANSDGALAFCEWTHFGKIGLVIPTEIAALEGRGETDFPKDVSIGRRGCYKTQWTIHTHPSHGYKTQRPNSITAWVELYNIFLSQFQSHHAVREVLGKEFFDFRAIESHANGDSMPEDLHALPRLRTVDRSTEEAKRWHDEVFSRIVKDRGWESPGLDERMVIRARASDAGITQYPSFVVPADLPLMRLCNRETRRFYHDNVREGTTVRLVGSGGHSDENIYYARLEELRGEPVPMWHIHSRGGSEHSPNEYVFEDSVVNASGCIEHLINQAVPAHLAGERQSDEATAE